MDELLGEFIAETLETLETLSSEVVAWEADPTDRQRLDAFFRFFHTVKGSCGFLNLPRFERLSHAAEDVLSAIRSGERAADAATISAVLAMMDRIEALARALGEGADLLPEVEDDRLLDALAAPSAAVEVAIVPASEPERADQDAPSPAAAPSREKSPRTIRLPLTLIDQMMNGVSDMVLARNELARKMRERGVDPDLESSFERLSANVADMRDMISKTRMQRVDRLYVALPRLVRDLSRDLGKQVSLEVDGGDVEMDREMIEMVIDPLTHIVRNALDHGLEPPAERLAAGKPEAGMLRIVARQSGNQIVIEVSDDGRGIDRAALVERAVARGLVSKAQAAALDDQAKLQLICHPGLSTARAVTAVSGRGVGMDVVRANVEQIGGAIGIESRPRHGTTITMRVPLTLTIIPGLILRCGDRHFAMPRGNVVELLHDNSAMVAMETIGGARIATIRGERHAFIDLEDVLGLAMADSQGKDGRSGPRTMLVVRSSGGIPYALGVEAVESNEELVIRPASPLVATAGVYAGMTLPDNGQPMLLLDAAGIAETARLPLRQSAPAAVEAAAEQAGEASIRALHYIERDGTHRLMPLSVIDRVEDIAAGSIGTVSGRTLVTIDGRLVPALQSGDAAGSTVKALRLRAGTELLFYMIADIVDIVDVAPPRAGRRRKSGAAGDVVLVGGKPYELADPFLLFARVGGDGAASRAGAVRRCVIASDDPWMAEILAPLLRQAGHEVVLGGPGGEDSDEDALVIVGDEEGGRAVPGGQPVLRLRARETADARDPASVYRYDRDGLLAAIDRLGRERAA